jgi:hypothetical protein
MLPHATVDEADFLICPKRYLSLRLQARSPEDTEEILRYLHRNEPVVKLYDIVNHGKNPFEAFTLRCDGTECTGCRLQPYCCQKRVLEIADILNDQSNKLIFDDFCVQMHNLIVS